jgi:hypothetical protein
MAKLMIGKIIMAKPTQFFFKLWKNNHDYINYNSINHI